MTNEIEKVSKGMVFGVFDGLHPGHEYILIRAAELCEELIVVVTLDQVVAEIKGRSPKNDYNARVGALRNFSEKFIIVPGDSKVGSWEVLKRHKPDTIYLGYDQQAIAAELEKMKQPFVYVESFEPMKYKSSLL